MIKEKKSVSFGIGIKEYRDQNKKTRLMTRRLKSIIILALCSLAASAATFAGVSSSVPKSVRADAKYLFYLHGAWIEKHGLEGSHPQHGPYEYERIVRTFSEKGFEVISEARLGEVHPRIYAEGIAHQVRFLLESGVLPEQIAVAGHSKGGQMALIVASLVGESRVNYVVMAGCGKKGTEFRRSFEKFLGSHASGLKGRILSLFDSSDREAGTCAEAFTRAEEVETKEIILKTGRGHGLFYSPEPAWIDWVVDWTK